MPHQNWKWQGRIDQADGPQALRWHQVIQPVDQHTAAKTVTLLGFACDAGVARNQGRVGAQHGPFALRQALANLPAQAFASQAFASQEFVQKSAQLPAPDHQALADAGDIVCMGDDLEIAQRQYANKISELLQQQLFPIGLGGGHEIAYASYCGLAQYVQQNQGQPSPLSEGVATSTSSTTPAITATPDSAKRTPPKIGIINFDAHFDLRGDQQPSSGTPFRQIAEDCAKRNWPFHYCCLGVSAFSNTAALFHRAQQLNVTWLRDDEMTERGLPHAISVLESFMASVDHIYFTLCLDVLPASVMPGVSAPSARGVSLDVIEVLLDVICQSNKLMLFDIAELNPTYDIDHHSARVAARLVAKVAVGVGWMSK